MEEIWPEFFESVLAMFAIHIYGVARFELVGEFFTCFCASGREKNVSSMPSGCQSFVWRKSPNQEFVRVSITYPTVAYMMFWYCHVVLGSAVMGGCLNERTRSRSEAPGEP